MIKLKTIIEQQLSGSSVDAAPYMSKVDSHMSSRVSGDSKNHWNNLRKHLEYYYTTVADDYIRTQMQSDLGKLSFNNDPDQFNIRAANNIYMTNTDLLGLGRSNVNRWIPDVFPEYNPKDLGAGECAIALAMDGGKWIGGNEKGDYEYDGTIIDIKDQTKTPTYSKIPGKPDTVGNVISGVESPTQAKSAAIGGTANVSFNSEKLIQLQKTMMFVLRFIRLYEQGKLTSALTVSDSTKKQLLQVMQYAKSTVSNPDNEDAYDEWLKTFPTLAKMYDVQFETDSNKLERFMTIAARLKSTIQVQCFLNKLRDFIVNNQEELQQTSMGQKIANMKNNEVFSDNFYIRNLKNSVNLEIVNSTVTDPADELEHKYKYIIFIDYAGNKPPHMVSTAEDYIATGLHSRSSTKWAQQREPVRKPDGKIKRVKVYDDDGNRVLKRNKRGKLQPEFSNVNVSVLYHSMLERYGSLEQVSNLDPCSPENYKLKQQDPKYLYIIKQIQSQRNNVTEQESVDYSTMSLLDLIKF